MVRPRKARVIMQPGDTVTVTLEERSRRGYESLSKAA